MPGEALYDMAVTDESQSAATGDALYDTAGIDESQSARPMYAEATVGDGIHGTLDEATFVATVTACMLTSLSDCMSFRRHSARS